MVEKSRLEVATAGKASSGSAPSDKASPDKASPDSGGAWYRSPLALVAGLILFAGVLVAIVLAATSGGGTDSQVARSGSIEFGGIDVPEVSSVTIEGDTLPPLVPGEPDPAIGTSAPVVAATSLANGSEISLGKGRARVIGFFAHWCSHCQAELPELTAWLAANDLPPNTEFIAVSTAVDESRGNYPPSAWFTAENFSSPVLVDDAQGSLLGGFGFSGFPAFVAMDSSGIVVARAGGNIGVEGFEDMLSNFAS